MKALTPAQLINLAAIETSRLDAIELRRLVQTYEWIGCSPVISNTRSTSDCIGNLVSVCDDLVDKGRSYGASVYDQVLSGRVSGALLLVDARQPGTRHGRCEQQLCSRSAAP